MPENEINASRQVNTQLSFALYGAANRMARLHKPFLAPLGLTFPQYLVVLELLGKTPQSVGELGAKLGMDTGTITPLLKRLASAGMVTRTRDPADERRVLVDLTEAAEVLRHDILGVTDQIKTACQLTDEGANELRTTLEALARPTSNSINDSPILKETPMNIAIIGAGHIGATLARKLAANGHQVKLANSKGPEFIQDLAHSIGAVAVSKEEAVKDVEVIILSIPFARYSELAGLFSDVPENVVVIDTSNYYPLRDGNITEVDEGKPEGVWVSEQIGRPVIKAWNAVLAETLVGKGTAAGTPGRIALPVAGDDEKAKGVVLRLVDATGFDALDAGTLAESWRQQPGTPGYCTELTLNELPAALAAADQQRAAHNRDALMKQFMSASTPATHDEMVTLNRNMTA